MNEETMPFAQTSKGFIGVDDAGVRDNINSLLTGATAKSFLTPYSALEKVSKVLANYHIFLPKYTFAEGNSGVTAFEVNQFGEKMGMTNQGIVKTVEDLPYFIYFEYQMNDLGMFEVFSEIVTEDELSELMDEYNEEDEEEDESEEEEMNEAAKKPSPYHDSYSSAIQTAVSHAKKRGYEVDADDYHAKVSSGPRKPSEGKTVSHNIKLTKDGKPTKKGLAIQVYNKGGDTPFELNHYISEETSINEVSKKLLGNYLSKKNMEKGRPGKKAKSMELAIGKMVNNPKYLKVKVAATNEEAEQINEIGDTPKGKAAINKMAMRADKRLEKARSLKSAEKPMKALSLAINKDEKSGGKILNKYLKNYAMTEAKEKESDAPFEGAVKKKTPDASKRAKQMAKKIEKAMAKYNKNK